MVRIPVELLFKFTLPFDMPDFGKSCMNLKFWNSYLFSIAVILKIPYIQIHLNKHTCFLVRIKIAHMSYLL